MFDFLDSDWFIIVLEIVFLVFIIYDIERYSETKKKEYITNIVLTIGFAIWALMPMYTKYFGWEENQRQLLAKGCVGDENATKICHCVNDSLEKKFTHDEYVTLKQQEKEFNEFIKEAKEDCLDDSWF
jgi:hypothetical protein